MNIADMTNGLFEAVSGAFVWMNALKIYRDREVKGVWWQGTIWFSLWGLYNLYYYPHLGQWWSFAGGLVIVSGNIAWLSQVIYYLRRNNAQSIARRAGQIEIDWNVDRPGLPPKEPVAFSAHCDCWKNGKDCGCR